MIAAATDNVVAGAVHSQSSGVLVLEGLDDAVFYLVLGHFAHNLQFRFWRLPQPPKHLDGLPVFGRPVPVAGPPRPLHFHDPRQRRGWLVVRFPAHHRLLLLLLLLFAVDHHPGRSLRVSRLPRRQVGSGRRRVRRETRSETIRIRRLGGTYTDILLLVYN